MHVLAWRGRRVAGALRVRPGRARRGGTGVAYRSESERTGSSRTRVPRRFVCAWVGRARNVGARRRAEPRGNAQVRSQPPARRGTDMQLPPGDTASQSSYMHVPATLAGRQSSYMHVPATLASRQSSYMHVPATLASRQSSYMHVPATLAGRQSSYVHVPATLAGRQSSYMHVPAALAGTSGSYAPVPVVIAGTPSSYAHQPCFLARTPSGCMKVGAFLVCTPELVHAPRSRPSRWRDEIEQPEAALHCAGRARGEARTERGRGD
jgi:hypothetical protein